MATAMAMIPDFIVHKMAVNAVRFAKVTDRVPTVVSALGDYIDFHCAPPVSDEIREYMFREVATGDGTSSPTWFGISQEIPLAQPVIESLATYTGLLARVLNDEGIPMQAAIRDAVGPIMDDAVEYACPIMVEALVDHAVSWSGLERAFCDAYTVKAALAVDKDPDTLARWNVFHALLRHASKACVNQLKIDATHELANVIKSYSNPETGCNMVTCHADVMEAIHDVVRWTRDCPFPFRTCDHVEWLATHGRNLLASMSSHTDPTEREELFKVLEAHDERGSLALLKPMLL